MVAGSADMLIWYHYPWLFVLIVTHPLFASGMLPKLLNENTDINPPNLLLTSQIMGIFIILKKLNWNIHTIQDKFDSLLLSKYQ